MPDFDKTRDKQSFNITENALHVWAIPVPESLLEEQSSQLQMEETLNQLSESERQQAQKFSDQVSQNNYIFTHIAMRRILARYLNTSARELAVVTTSLGKPHLKSGEYTIDLRFNLSHTQGLAVLAITENQEVGIDIEKLGRKRKIIPLAQRYFAERTCTELAYLTGEQQELAFLKLWTQFEAYKKTKGEGLRGGDKALPLSLDFVTKGQFRKLLPEGISKTNWQAITLDIEGFKQYTTSIVIAKKPTSLSIYTASETNQITDFNNQLKE